MIIPLTEVSDKSGSLFLENENFGFGHVKFEVLVEHQDRDIQLLIQNARQFRKEPRAREIKGW